MTATIDITETAVIKALGDFISGIVSCPVLRAQANRVSMPVGDFIMMTPTNALPLSTNVEAFTDTTKTVERATQFTVQVDSYGVRANERAVTIATLLRDDVACASFAASGFDIQPLYAGDAHQMPLITGEEQYLERWTFEAVLQFNPVLTVAIQSATGVSVGLIDVDVQYPPT